MTARKKTTLWVSAVLALLVVVALLWAFAPWTAFVKKTVDEAAPAQVAASANPSTTVMPPQIGNVTLARGEFRGFEHDTSGQATLLMTPTGETVVRLSDLRTSNGPDVRVWLSGKSVDQANGANSGRYVDLGALKGNIGNQNYVLPPAAADQTWDSVVIWCERFSVAFGAAPLTPEAPTNR
ncbi:MAG: DM13 domain-containing protein [Candidatus Nanopelagicales bacterium]